MKSKKLKTTLTMNEKQKNTLEELKKNIVTEDLDYYVGYRGWILATPKEDDYISSSIIEHLINHDGVIVICTSVDDNGKPACEFILKK